MKKPHQTVIAVLLGRMGGRVRTPCQLRYERKLTGSL